MDQFARNEPEPVIRQVDAGGIPRADAAIAKRDGERDFLRGFEERRQGPSMENESG
jgi:hypothetical protein